MASAVCEAFAPHPSLESFKALCDDPNEAEALFNLAVHRAASQKTESEPPGFG
jgi:hypothetical protein